MIEHTFDGIYPALITPFNTTGAIDELALIDLTRWHIDQGVAGFYVGGSTGESLLLTSEERKRVLEIVAYEAQGKADVIAHIGSFSTRQAVELAQHASDVGVRAVSSVPPFYYKHTLSELAAYYADIASESGLPIILYNVPALSGIAFKSGELSDLFADPNIIGVKHTSYDMYQMERLISGYPDKTVFGGHDELFLSALAIGARGSIGSTFNFMPGLFRSLREAFDNRRLEEAALLQKRVNNIIDVLLEVGVFPGVKAALQWLGRPCGECRKPFQPLTAAERRKLSSVLENNL